MVKGVNKNVIEICDTGNDYFERVILFVRPGNAANCDSDALRLQADQFLTGLKVRSWWRPRRKTFFAAIRMLSAAALGAAAACALLIY